MPLRIAIQMDPIESISPQIDSTLLMGLEAQRRGYELYYYTPDKLAWRDGAVTASAHRVVFRSDPMHYYDLGEPLTLDLKSVDVVLLRQDPPFDMAYITNTYLLERLLPRPLVVNNPASVRNYPEKLLPTLLLQFMPPTLITADIGEIERFRAEHKDIVIKPLYSVAGRSVFRLKQDDSNFHVLMGMIFSESREPWMVQRFLPEIAEGDHRVTMIDGEVAGVFSRIPAKADFRANLHAGATLVKTELTPKQRDICKALKPILKEAGLLFAGVDMIGDYLTEVNLTSPGGLRQLTQIYGTSLEPKLWDTIEKRL